MPDITHNRIHKIILTGGGTMGSVSPLIAVYDELKSRPEEWEVLWIGTADGPEKEVVEGQGIKFAAIASGKFRRYFSLKNIIDPFKVLWGVHQSKKIIKEFQPDIVLTAGSYVAYPVARAASKKSVPVFIHQQDIEKGLANRMMKKYATAVTITFDTSLGDFDIKKTYYTSNPIRMDRLQCDAKKAQEIFNLDPNRSTILVTGGGTGAQALNQLTLEALGEWTKRFQVVHLTGAGKSISNLIPDYYTRDVARQIEKHYHPVEYLEEGMCEILRYADIVVTRAGISTLTELSVLGKTSVIIPIPDSHQEANANYYAKYNAAKVLNQKTLTGEVFAETVRELAENPADMRVLSKNISKMIDPGAAKRYVDLIYKFLQIG